MTRRALHVDFRPTYIKYDMPGATKHSNKSKLTHVNISGVVVAVNVAIRVLGWGLEVLPSHC
jgi:hypothetical protein